MKKIFLTFSAIIFLLSCNSNKAETKKESSENKNQEYNKILNSDGIEFKISSENKDNKNIVSISTKGLSEVEYNETFDIKNYEITNSEVADLDSDGSPELFIYTQSKDKEKYTKVLIFSVNNKKSMSEAFFAEDNKSQSQNKFFIEGKHLCEVSSSNQQKVCYKLVNGEASKLLKTDIDSK